MPRIAALALALVVAAGAHAIERLKPQILETPQGSLGGKVLAVRTATVDGEGPTLRAGGGYYLDPQNGKRSTVWAQFGTPNNAMKLHVLPAPGESQANDVMYDPDD